MFGPLNGVRIALVISAAVAAIVAWALGFHAAGWVLFGGVIIHGAGWIYLYNKNGHQTR